MEKALIKNISLKDPRNIIIVRGFFWGLIGGFTGTLVMDIVLMGVLLAIGLPALACFSIVGSTVSHLFSFFGIHLTNYIHLGVATHYIVGPIIGALFGVALAYRKTFRVNTLKESITWAVICVEILSQPLLTMASVLLKMNLPETLKWFSGSFVMHLICSVILGVIVHKGLHSSLR